jgi:hypothetical protein
MFVPVSVGPWLPLTSAAIVSELLEIFATGVVLITANGSAAAVAAFGAAFDTVTRFVPANAISAGRMVAVSCELLT